MRRNTRSLGKESDGDEEYAALPEFHRFVIPEGSHWNDIREATSNVGLKIEPCLREIEAANQEYLYGNFGDAQWFHPSGFILENLNISFRISRNVS
ncbi:MAG: hypothetical protein LAT55_02160 [Opitutales bacterium]|nr:hypothetical protein [Opitutales bacterium]